MSSLKMSSCFRCLHGCMFACVCVCVRVWGLISVCVGVWMCGCMHACICSVYLLHYYQYYGLDGVSRHPTGNYIYENAHEVTVMALLVFVIGWCCTIMYGRLYLGMHSPVDIMSGVVIAAVLLTFHISCEDFIDAWMTRGTLLPVYQPIFCTLLVWCYPKPMRRTPSYNYVTYFAGTVLGVTCSVWFFYAEYHSPEAMRRTIAARGSLLSLAGIWWALKRSLVGFIIVLAARAVMKQIAVLIVPLVASLLGFEIYIDDNDAPDAARKKTDDGSKDAVKGETNDGMALNKGRAKRTASGTLLSALSGNVVRDGKVPIRMITYAAVGWSVTSTVPWVFDWLEI
eukprot:m.388127 g.388127  ORF g.388127 m.388127 type:complete len:341 (+) comp21043_c0_seq11:1125-2147(+)